MFSPNLKSGLENMVIFPARFFWRSLLDFVYPPCCLLCNADLAEGDVLVCRICLDTLPRLEEPVADAGKLVHQLSGPAWFEASLALYSYQESMHKLIHLFKYKGYKSLAHVLGTELGRLLCETALPGNLLLAPVPLHKRRLRERGYNQSQLLTAQVAVISGIAFDMELLHRIRYTRPQAKLTKAARSRNLAGAFELTRPEALEHLTVILVDDLFTTGHTLNECAKTLIFNGCRRVYCLTLIRV